MMWVINCQRTSLNLYSPFCRDKDEADYVQLMCKAYNCRWFMTGHWAASQIWQWKCKISPWLLVHLCLQFIACLDQGQGYSPCSPSISFHPLCQCTMNIILVFPGIQEGLLRILYDTSFSLFMYVIWKIPKFPFKWLFN